MNHSRQDMYSIGQETVSDGTATSAVQSFVLRDHEPRDSVNSILSCLQQSPIISKTTTLLEDQTPGAVRRLTAKLRRAVAAATSTITNSIASGQGESLVNLAGLNTVLTSQNSAQPYKASIDEVFLDHLVGMYEAYESRNLPYNEKIRLLALIPKGSDLSCEEIQNRFQCTNHAIKTARALRTASKTPLHTDMRKWVIPHSFTRSESDFVISRSITRQRRDPKLINHFLAGLIDATLLVSVSWDQLDWNSTVVWRCRFLAKFSRPSVITWCINTKNIALKWTSIRSVTGNYYIYWKVSTFVHRSKSLA